MAFFAYYLGIDLSGGEVAESTQADIHEAFVVPQVQVCFSAVVKYIDFPVLVGRHCPGIHIDIWIQFLHGDLKTAVILSNKPVAAAVTPFPTELTTPPVKKIYFVGILTPSTLN